MEEPFLTNNNNNNNTVNMLRYGLERPAITRIEIIWMGFV